MSWANEVHTVLSTKAAPGTTLKLKLLGPVLLLRGKSQNVYTRPGSKTSQACSLSSAPGGRWTRRCQGNQCLTPSSSPSGACWLLSWSRTRTLLQFLLNCCHRNLMWVTYFTTSHFLPNDERWTSACSKAQSQNQLAANLQSLTAELAGQGAHFITGSSIIYFV